MKFVDTGDGIDDNGGSPQTVKKDYIYVTWGWNSNYTAPLNFEIAIFTGTDPTASSNYIVPIQKALPTDRALQVNVPIKTQLTGLNSAVRAIFGGTTPPSPWTSTVVNAVTSVPAVTPLGTAAGVTSAQGAANTANAVIAQQNSASYMTNSDKISFVAQWVAESNTQTTLDAQAVAAGVSHTAYDNAVSNVSTGLITAGAPANWASIWPDGTTSGPWTNVLLTLNSLWAAVATQRAALVNSISAAGAAAAQTAAIASAATASSSAIATALTTAATTAQGYATTAKNNAVSAINTAVGAVVPGAVDAATAVSGLQAIATAALAGGINLIPNANSELGPISGVGGLYVAASGVAYSGTYCRILLGNPYVGLSPIIPCVAGQQFTWSLMALCNAASDSAMSIYFSWRNAAGGEISTSGYKAMTLNSTNYTQWSTTLTVPAGAVGVVFAVTSGTSGVTYYLDNLLAYQVTAETQAAAAAAAAAQQVHTFASFAALPALPSSSYPAGFGPVLTLSDGSMYRVDPSGATWDRIMFAATAVIGQLLASNVTVDASLQAAIVSAGAVKTQMLSVVTDATASGPGGTVQIGGGAIRAQSIGVQNLTVANFDNLVPNPGCQNISPAAGTLEAAGLYNWGAPYPGAIGTKLSPNGWVRVLSCGAGGNVFARLNLVPCAAGDVFTAQAQAVYCANFLGVVWAGLSFLKADGVTDVGDFYSTQGMGATFDFNSPTALSVTATAPAGAAYAAMFIQLYNPSAAQTVAFNNFYMRRCMDSSVVVDGSILTQKLAANAVMTSNFTTDTGQTASSLGATGVPSGNPTNGVWLGVGSASPMWSGPGGIKVGMPVYGGTYVSYKIDAPAVMSFNSLRTNYNVASPPQYPRFWYGGNCDGGTLGGAPNINRLTLNVTVWDTTNHIAWMDLVLVPSTASDNLDAMRYANIQFYRQSAAGTSGTLTAVGPIHKVTLPDRMYQDPASDGDGVNAVATTASAAHSGFSGGFLACIVTLYNAFGASASNCFYTPAGWTAGASLVNNGTSFPSGLSGGGSGGGGGGGGGIGCVPAGTPLLMADRSWLPIEQAGIGMEVAAWDDQTLQPVRARIARTFVFEDRALWRIVTTDGELVCSHDHRILQGDSWVPARESVVGTPTLWRLATGQLVYSTILEAAPTGDTATVYHVGLDHGHVYCAGDILAHNMKAPN